MLLPIAEIYPSQTIKIFRIPWSFLLCIQSIISWICHFGIANSRGRKVDLTWISGNWLSPFCSVTKLERLMADSHKRFVDCYSEPSRCNLHETGRVLANEITFPALHRFMMHQGDFSHPGTQIRHCTDQCINVLLWKMHLKYVLCFCKAFA